MDPFVELARLTIHHFTRHKKAPAEIPEHLREALAGQRAATFVSLHTLSGELRGCIGTLEPRHATLEEEIISNAISACSRDTRFPAIREDELDDLEIHVDVLSPMEPIQSASELDVKRYGVLVTAADGRRGVLLPDIETIDTVEDQITIACRKAGINPRHEAFTMERFTTTRHRAD
jgi:AmmeMemoRadiSam system protein A